MSSSYAAVRTRPALRRSHTAWLIALTVALASLRFCHLGVLWIDEDYHMGAALNMLHGKVPYRDFWYDKPPLAGFYYLLIGGYDGWPLRLLDSIYVLACASLLFQLAKRLWGAAEGLLAAFLFAFSMAFYLPSAVLPFAADAILLLPHCAAILFAQMRRPAWAGLCCGIGFLGNVKAVFVLAACVLWTYPSVTPLLLTALPFGSVFLWGAFREQIWVWGVAYAKASPVTHPLATGLTRSAGWVAFHGVPAVGSCVTLLRSSGQRRQLAGWLALSAAAVAVGARFTPHYFLQLLPPVCTTGAHGIVWAYGRFGRRVVVVGSVLLILPLARFLPHYITLAVTGDPQWSDLALDRDSRSVAGFIHSHAQAGDTLLVWGYRPDIYVLTRLVSDSFFWDSQPLTGVPADRHLMNAHSFYAPAAHNRILLAQTHPTWLVDGLGVMNPALAPAKYPELRDWFSRYQPVSGTKLSRIYHFR